MHRVFAILFLVACAQAQTDVGGSEKYFSSVRQVQIPASFFGQEIVQFVLREPPKVKAVGILGHFVFSTRYHTPTLKDAQPRPYRVATWPTHIGNFEGSMQSFEAPTHHNPSEVTRSVLSLTWTSRH